MSAFIFRRAVWLLPIMLVVVPSACLLLQVSPSTLCDGRGLVLPASHSLFAAPENGSGWQSPVGNSIRLMLVGAALGLGLGFPMGLLAALGRGNWLDKSIQALCSLFISLPGLVLAGLVLGVMAWMGKAGATPDWEKPAAWLAPALVTGSGLLGFTARIVNEALLQALGQDYALAARAKGLTEREMVIRHLLRNTWITVTNRLTPALTSLVLGSWLVEAVFGYPGMGRLFVQAILQGERELVWSGVIIYAFLAALAGLVADVLAAALEPRLREERQR